MPIAMEVMKIVKVIYIVGNMLTMIINVVKNINTLLEIRVIGAVN